MVTASTFARTPALYKELPYDPVGGFVPVGGLAIGNLAHVVNPALGVDQGRSRALVKVVAVAKISVD